MTAMGGKRTLIDRPRPLGRLCEMKCLSFAAVLFCFGCSSVAAGQSKNGIDAPPPSYRYLNEWSACQREFVTPRLQSSEPIPTVVEKAHAHCLSREQTLKEALNTEHGPEQGASILDSIKEATDQIMCGLLTSTRMPGAKKVAFDTAADCLSGNIRVTP